MFDSGLKITYNYTSKKKKKILAQSKFWSKKISSYSSCLLPAYNGEEWFVQLYIPVYKNALYDAVV